MKKIDGVARSLAEILKGNKFEIDYYQREYRWEAKQLEELVDDLVDRFDGAWEPDHERDRVDQYPYYFLGSIILSEKDAHRFVVDGQQRLTSLTLLLAFLRRLQQGRAEKDVVAIDDLILSVKYGKKSFNLDVEERVPAMTALYEHGTYMPPADASPSVATLVARYEQLDSLIDEDMRGERLPYFIEWLLHKVQIVQITAYADDDAYAIFETMNDRGLRLTPADMLKGYVLTRVPETDRSAADALWRKRARELAEHEQDADSDFLKTWLRSQYARRIRERRKGALPEDWDRIGTEFHRWLKDNEKSIGLVVGEDFHRFVAIELDFYSRHYWRILRAASWEAVPAGMEYVAYNADHNFTLQNQLLLAPLRPEDGDVVAVRKMTLVAMYVDILLSRRIWNSRSIAYSTMQYAMFTTMRSIRHLAVPELAERLVGLLGGEEMDFDTNPRLRVHQQNRQMLHRLLARITDFVAVGSGHASLYLELTSRKKVRYEVEHIWANHPDQHEDEFPQAEDFREYRDRVGDLLLVPKSFNASYGDVSYVEKLPYYFGQNILAQSLHPNAYEHNPGFLQFVQSTGLPFHAHPNFAAADIQERGALYREIAKRVWSPERLLEVASLDRA